MTSSPEFEEKRSTEGESLEPAARARAEEALGHDLGGVRIHRGDEGARVSAEERAQAVTRGQRVYFSPQAWAPGTPEGERLLLHELAHAAQADRGGGASADREALEAEAERAAEAAAAGRRAPLRLRAGPGTALRQPATAPPTIQRHPQEIAPHPLTGTVSGGGFSIPYSYTVVPPPSFAALVLQVSEGVSVVVTPLTVESPDHRVQNAEGNRARAVVISVSSSLLHLPRVQVAFTRGSATYVVVFQFPQQPPPGPAPAKGPRP